MPPCRKTPTPLPAAPAGGACCPAPAPAPALACSCDDGSELACDEDTCANAADCKQLHPDICPHGIATDDDCTGCQPPPPAKLLELTLICPHCRSQISTLEDPNPKLLKTQSTMPQNYQSQPRKTWPVQKQPSYTRSPPASDPTTDGNDGFCAPNCPIKKLQEIQRKASNGSMASCCTTSSLKLRSPHINQIKSPKADEQPPPPPPPDMAVSCCMSASGTRSPHMGRTPARESFTCGGAGPKTCSDMGSSSSEPEPPGSKQIKKGTVMGNMGRPVQCKMCLQAATEPRTACSQPQQKGGQTAVRPARGSSSSGKEKVQLPSPPGPNPNCSRSGAGALFPAQPPQPACLCRMPPAYNYSCTGNLSGNCNCATCNK